MIQPQTRLIVADNSGAKQIMCFNIPGGTRRRYARVGDVIVGSVKQAQPNSAVRKGEVVRAVVVRTTAVTKRPDGSTIRFDDNAAVILGTGRDAARDPDIRARRSGAPRAQLHAYRFTGAGGPCSDDGASQSWR